MPHSTCRGCGMIPWSADEANAMADADGVCLNCVENGVDSEIDKPVAVDDRTDRIARVVFHVTAAIEKSAERTRPDGTPDYPAQAAHRLATLEFVLQQLERALEPTGWPVGTSLDEQLDAIPF